jgi:hypothetical protein
VHVDRCVCVCVRIVFVSKHVSRCGINIDIRKAGSRRNKSQDTIGMSIAFTPALRTTNSTSVRRHPTPSRSRTRDAPCEPRRHPPPREPRRRGARPARAPARRLRQGLARGSRGRRYGALGGESGSESVLLIDQEYRNGGADFSQQPEVQRLQEECL